MHPERDQVWRDKQTELSGVKGAAQECDCDFSTSGNQVVSVEVLEFYKQTYLKDPVEKRGNNQDLWIWDYPNYTKNYILTADCARGDGGDFSAFHVIDIETMEQVAEYKGQLTTKDYGNLLVSVATEYNNALLVVENNNVGWGTLQQIIDRDYQNTFYSATDLTIVDVEKSYSNKLHAQDKKLVAGFTTTSKSFSIPHPTKEGKKLVYGSLEGPENGVYHRGKLYNEDTIILPEYWYKLVDKDSVTVQLTSIGKHQNLFVKEVFEDKVIVGIEGGLFTNKTSSYTICSTPNSILRTNPFN